MGPPAAVMVEVEGCVLRDGPSRCILPAAGPPTRCESEHVIDPVSNALRLRAPADHGWSWHLDGARVRVPSQRVGDELEWTLDATAQGGRLELREVGRSMASWSIELEPYPVEPRLIQQARIALRDASVPPPWAALREALESLEGPHRVVALELLTEHAMLEAARFDDPTQRERAYRRALDDSSEAFAQLSAFGDPVRASCIARRASFTASFYLDDPEGAEPWQDRLVPRDGLSGPARVANAYHRGLHAQKLGDLGAALQAYEDVERGARHDRRRTYGVASLPQRAVALASLHRTQDVEALLDRVGELPIPRCRDWLRVLNSAAWARLQIGEQGVAIGDPSSELYDVEMLLNGRSDPDDPCGDAALEAVVGINLVFAALEGGRTGEARARFERLHPPGAGPGGASVRGWHELLELRLLLQEGEAGALREWLLRHPARLSDPRPPAERWRSHDWRGRAWEVLGRTEDAIASYRRAEAAVSGLVRRLDLDVAREGLLLGRQPSAARLIALLVEQGQPQEALCVARTARSRMDHLLDRTVLVGSLSVEGRRAWSAALGRVSKQRDALDALQQEAWAVPRDEVEAHRAKVATARTQLEETTRAAFDVLAAGRRRTSWQGACEARPRPAPGSVHVLYFPLEDGPNGRWMGFAFGASGVLATAPVSIPGAAPTVQAWSRALLDPLADALEPAEHVEVLPVGRLWSVPFAALPWRDGVLLEHAAVTVGLDLPRADGAEASPQPRRALVVGAPHGDLVGAEREARSVASSLTAQGWDVELLLREQATAQSVRKGLADAGLLHYAGHGRRSGLEGWGSRLQLSAEGELNPRDILALPSVPEVALLLACEATPASVHTLGGGMSLARAFILAGSDTVVASDGRLDDAFAERMAGRIYDAGIPASTDVHQQLKHARLAERDGDWWRLRVLRP